MPSLAHGLFTGEAQEQLLPAVLLKGDAGGHENDAEVRKSPLCTNFFSEDQRQEEQQLGNIVEMTARGLLEEAQRRQEMGSQALRNVFEMSLQWIRAPTLTTLKLEEGPHDLSLHMDNKCFDKTMTIEGGTEGEEDKEHLGMLLSMPIASAEHDSSSPSARKRSRSMMLEPPQELDPELRLSRSHTSSDSGEGTQSSAGAARNLLKMRRTEKPLDKDLLCLSLPVSNSSMNSETSSSSQDRDSQSAEPKSGAPFRFRKIHPDSANDGAQSNMRSATAATNSPTISLVQLDSPDDAAGRRSASPVAPHDSGLSLRWDALSEKTKSREGRRAKFRPLTCAGLDAEALNQQSLLLRDLDTGLETHGLQLVHLLLQCADATAKGNVKAAAGVLRELYQGSSVYGDSMQRVAAYFAEGLAARIVSKDSPMYANLMVQPSTEQYCSAFTTLYKAAPYFQFAHFTANQAILEAVEGQQCVHVIDLDIMQGFQWPSLIQALASREGGPPQLLRLTGVGQHANVIQETGRRLASFAASFGVPFEFNSVVEEKLENLTVKALAPRQGEATAVNAVHQLHRLLNPTSGENLHEFMHSLCRKLRPRVVTLVEQEANHNAPSFLGRFMEALHYYAAVFDSLDAALPQQNEERVKVEQMFFAQQIKNIVVSDGTERVERHETFDLWQQRMEMAGFVQAPLSAHAVSQAKLLLQFSPCEGYRLHERNGSICLGWQERQLLTASAWIC